MATLIDKIRQFFRSERSMGMETAVSATTLTLNDAALTQLMQQVAKTEEGQYTCEETFALLDEYAELVVSGAEAAALMPLVEAHLRVCPECGPRFDALRTILESETA
jgi:hypothetical protein